MRGNITRRGRSSWRLKIEREPNADGSRNIRWETVRGKRQDAETRLTELLGALDKNTLIDRSDVTIAEYVRGWLDGARRLAEDCRALQAARRAADYPAPWRDRATEAPPGAGSGMARHLTEGGRQGSAAALGPHCRTRASGLAQGALARDRR